MMKKYTPVVLSVGLAATQTEAKDYNSYYNGKKEDYGVGKSKEGLGKKDVEKRPINSKPQYTKDEMKDMVQDRNSKPQYTMDEMKEKYQKNYDKKTIPDNAVDYGNMVKAYFGGDYEKAKHFFKGDSKPVENILPNQKQCPENCKTYFDGCNTCKCLSDGAMACTKKMCMTLHDRSNPARCLDDEQSPEKPKPRPEKPVMSEEDRQKMEEEKREIESKKRAEHEAQKKKEEEARAAEREAKQKEMEEKEAAALKAREEAIAKLEEEKKKQEAEAALQEREAALVALKEKEAALRVEREAEMELMKAEEEKKRAERKALDDKKREEQKSLREEFMKLQDEEDEAIRLEKEMLLKEQAEALKKEADATRKAEMEQRKQEHETAKEAKKQEELANREELNQLKENVMEADKKLLEILPDDEKEKLIALNDKKSSWWSSVKDMTKDEFKEKYPEKFSEMEKDMKRKKLFGNMTNFLKDLKASNMTKSEFIAEFPEKYSDYLNVAERKNGDKQFDGKKEGQPRSDDWKKGGVDEEFFALMKEEGMTKDEFVEKFPEKVGYIERVMEKKKRQEEYNLAKKEALANIATMSDEQKQQAKQQLMESFPEFFNGKKRDEQTSDKKFEADFEGIKIDLSEMELEDLQEKYPDTMSDIEEKVMVQALYYGKESSMGSYENKKSYDKGSYESKEKPQPKEPVRDPNSNSNSGTPMTRPAPEPPVREPNSDSNYNSGSNPARPRPEPVKDKSNTNYENKDKSYEDKRDSDEKEMKELAKQRENGKGEESEAYQREKAWQELVDMMMEDGSDKKSDSKPPANKDSNSKIRTAKTQEADNQLMRLMEKQKKDGKNDIKKDIKGRPMLDSKKKEEEETELRNMMQTIERMAFFAEGEEKEMLNKRAQQMKTMADGKK